MRTRQTETSGNTRNPFRWVILSLVGFAVLSGCGESQDDMIARALKRRRPVLNADSDSDDNVAAAERKQDRRSAPAPNEPVERVASRQTERRPDQTPPVTATSSTAESAAEVEQAGSEDPKSESEEILDVGILPIGQRKPQTPLSEPERRQRSIDNLKAIHAGIMKFTEKNFEAFPKVSSKSGGGIPTLSWRVSLLPALGYPKLFAEFDRSKPWDEEPNLSLLKYIPDEFVSPERFDTSTNFQLPVGNSFVFSNKKTISLGQIEDGIDNTIFLLEVDDDRAVPWTKPADYSPRFALGNYKPLTEGIGNLRGDGTFAIWGNGWPVLLSNALRPDQVFKAFTYDALDGQLARNIHREIDIEAVASEAASPDRSDANEVVVSASRRGPVSLESVERMRIPVGSQIASARRRVDEIYKSDVREAKEPEDKVSLAREMLRTTNAMQTDPAGAYALQSTVMKLAKDAGSIKILLNAVDSRTQQFDVDVYQENVDALSDFARSNLSEELKSGDVDLFLGRSILTIREGILLDDYENASALARFAFRFLDKEHDEDLRRMYSRLRVQLDSAQKQFDQAKEQLAAYRRNPEDQRAASTFGRYLCFIKGDWTNGLPLLAKGSVKSLRDIAETDLEGARTAQDEVAIGDAWWEMSQRARGAVYRQGAMDRAAYWYESAYQQLPESLDKMHVKARLDDRSEADASSPLALVVQIADELGVKLNRSLVEVSRSGYTGGRRGDDDEDD